MIVLAISDVVTVHSVDNEFSKCIHTLGPTVHTLTFTLKKKSRDWLNIQSWRSLTSCGLVLKVTRVKLILRARQLKTTKCWPSNLSLKTYCHVLTLEVYGQKVLLIERLSK